MRGKTAQRIYVAVGVGLAILMGLSLFAPALTPAPTTDVPDPTRTPAPTQPPPITDFSGINFDQEEYLHPSGLFVISVPTGWEPSAPANSGVQAQANLNNPDALSVVEVSLQQPNPMVTNVDELSAIYTQGFLAGSWSNYSSWDELARQRDEENGRLLIDFQLSRQGQNYLARQASWFDDDYVYYVRVVVTDNMIDLMNFMLEEMVDQVRVNRQFVNTPLGWTSYFDQFDQHIFRYPQNWRVTDRVNDGPASIESADGTVRVRVEAFADGEIADEDAAIAYVESLLPGGEVLSVAPVERFDADSGFAVSYRFRDADGAPQSGQVVLLNGVDGQLHVLNGLVANADIDFNTYDPEQAAVAGPEATPDPSAPPFDPNYVDFSQAMETFSLLTGLNLPEPPPEPTPTPFPTVAPEVTPEMTPEATPEADPETTPEVTPEADE